MTDEQNIERFLSDIDLANQTLGVLRQFDDQIQAAKLERAGEGKAWEDDMPGQGKTYRERVDWLEARKTEIVAENADIMDQVRELRDQAIAAQKAQADQAKQTAAAAATAPAPVVP